MLSWYRGNFLALAVSAIVHGLLLYFLFRAAHVIMTSDSAAPLESQEPIESIVVSIPEETVQAVMKELEEQNKDLEVIGLQKRDEEKLRAEREAEEKRLAEIKRQEAEKRRLAEQKKREEEELKRKQEEERLAAEKRRQEAEAKAKADAEAKAKAEAEQQAQAERVAQQRREQEAAEARQRTEAAASANQQAGGTGGGGGTSRDAGGGGGVVYDRYIAQIRSKIQRNWQPVVSDPGLKTELRLTLFPGGGVADVKVIKSSGNAAFDQSAQEAVRRSDPLPVPSGSDFDPFRSFILIFSPDRIR